jgi:ATP-dependent Clp protease ATP-binding subunit ClpA
MNRLDKVVVFKPLNRIELRKILGLELSILQQRIFLSSSNAPFVFSLTEAARDSLLLKAGT